MDNTSTQMLYAESVVRSKHGRLGTYGRSRHRCLRRHLLPACRSLFASNGHHQPESASVAHPAARVWILIDRLSVSISRFTLALATSWSSNHDACLHRVEPLIWLFLPFEFKHDRCRLEDDHVTAALLAPAALPPVLTYAAATAILAPAVLPPVLAVAAAAAILALAALPPVLADAAATAFLALAALPPVLTEAAAAAILAPVAPPPVLAEATAATLLTLGAPPPVLADAAAAALLAAAAHSPVLAYAAAAAVLAGVVLSPVLANAAADALLAGAAPPPVLADALAPAVLAEVAPPLVLTDAAAAALLAGAALPPVLAGHLSSRSAARLTTRLVGTHNSSRLRSEEVAENTARCGLSLFTWFFVAASLQTAEALAAGAHGRHAAAQARRRPSG